MDAAQLAELLSAPALVFTLAVAVFLVLMRSPWPWTRAGGAVLAAAVLAALGLALRDPELRRAALGSEGLPILILALASAAATWGAFHAPSRGERPAAVWKGITQAEALLGGLAVLGVAFAAFFLRAQLGPMAGAAPAGDDPAAPWFLLALQELLGYFDPWVAFALLPVLTVAGLLALPHLDVSRRRGADFEERRDVVYFFLFVWFLLALGPMTAALLFDRGPAVPVALSKPLSELVWAAGPPRSVWLRELPAAALLALYFFVLPRVLPRWGPTRALFGRYVKRMGPRRYFLAMAFIQVWMLVPLKMYARWLFGIGYFVYLPELGLNF